MRLGIALLFVVLAAVPAWAADQGRIASLTGSLTVNGRAAAQGGAVREGDVLETGPGAAADVVMQSGVRFRLYNETRLEIPAESYQNPVRLAFGRLLSIVTKGRKFAVAGRTAVAGVRGTTFYVESQKDRRTYICICKGKLHVSGAQGADKGDIQSEHHYAVAVDDHSKSDEPMIGHTDDEIAELQAR